jgi:hypothetical protein
MYGLVLLYACCHGILSSPEAVFRSFCSLLCGGDISNPLNLEGEEGSSDIPYPAMVLEGLDVSGYILSFD